MAKSPPWTTVKRDVYIRRQPLVAGIILISSFSGVCFCSSSFFFLFFLSNLIFEFYVLNLVGEKPLWFASTSTLSPLYIGFVCNHVDCFLSIGTKSYGSCGLLRDGREFHLGLNSRKVFLGVLSLFLWRWNAIELSRWDFREFYAYKRQRRCSI